MFTAYPDDLILITASVVKLQKMLDVCTVCSTYGKRLRIRFNPTKYCLFKIGKYFSKNERALCIDGQNIAWVDTFKYLGIYTVSQ